MDTGIHVGNIIDKGFSENLESLITSIFRVGHETRMEQSTIVEALKVIKDVTEVKQVTLHDCSLKSLE